MEPVSELEQLKQEVAALRAQVTLLQQQHDELRQFLVVSKCSLAPDKRTLSIECGLLCVSHPGHPKSPRLRLMASDKGAEIFMSDSEHHARLQILTAPDSAHLRLFANGTCRAVELSVEEPSGRGQVAVFEAEKPRALMKAAPDHGVVSVTHDDGLVRAFLSANADAGEFVALGPDMKAAVRIHSSARNGGAISVHGHNGKHAVLLGSTEQHGAVIVNDAQGRTIASLPDAGWDKPDAKDK